MTDAATVARYAVEADEREDARNRMLDMIETVAVDQELVAPLFARLKARLPARTGQPAAPGACDPEREMKLAGVLTALRTIDTFRKAREHAKQIDAAKAFITEELAAARAVRKAGEA